MKKEDLIYNLIRAISKNCHRVSIQLGSMIYESRRHLVQYFQITNAPNFEFKIDIIEGNNTFKIQISCEEIESIYFGKIFKKGEELSFNEWEDLFFLLNQIHEKPKFMEYWYTEDTDSISFFRWRLRNLFYKIINIWQ